MRSGLYVVDDVGDNLGMSKRIFHYGIGEDV